MPTGRRPRISSQQLRDAAAQRRAMEAAQRAGGVTLGGTAADLSREAIAMRERGDSRLTARALGDKAALVMEAGNRLQRVAIKRRGGKRQERAAHRAREALLTAAVQLRMAEATPLDRHPLHHLPFQQVQKIEAQVRALVADNHTEQWARLAADTHRRIQAHHARKRLETPR